MRTVWKYELWNPDTAFTREVRLPMPYRAKLLRVEMQRGVLCLWAQVGADAPIAQYTFWIVGTGQEIPLDASAHVGTVFDGRLVWHVYTKDPEVMP